MWISFQTSCERGPAEFSTLYIRRMTFHIILGSSKYYSTILNNVWSGLENILSASSIAWCARTSSQSWETKDIAMFDHVISNCICQQMDHIRDFSERISCGT